MFSHAWHTWIRKAKGYRPKSFPPDRLPPFLKVGFFILWHSLHGRGEFLKDPGDRKKRWGRGFKYNFIQRQRNELRPQISTAQWPLRSRSTPFEDHHAFSVTWGALCSRPRNSRKLLIPKNQQWGAGNRNKVFFPSWFSFPSDSRSRPWKAFLYEVSFRPRSWILLRLLRSPSGSWPIYTKNLIF